MRKAAMLGWLFGAMVAALILVATQAAAQATMAKPTGPVILTINGNIERGNDVDASGKPIACFDLEMLEGLGMTVISTSTPWHKGVQQFSGPGAAKLLNAVGATGKIARATALNDYSVEIPLSDLLTMNVILATRLQGKIMEVRDKGPVFVIYPFDKFSREVRETLYYRAAWQLATLTIQ